MAENARQCSKVFIGGLSWETTGEKLRAYFENYGVVREAFVSYNRNNGRPRGFGFVVFESPEVADKVVATKHTIDRREVEAKKAVPKDEQLQGEPQQGSQGSGSAPGSSSAPEAGSSSGPSSGAKSRKVFVGGLAPAVDEAALRQHFEAFGTVEDAVVMYDHDNKRPRGFGFVTFTSEDAIEQVFAKGAMQTILDKQIEIKSAVPRDQMPPSIRPGQGYPFDPRFAPAGPGPRGPPQGLYTNPYLPPQGLPSQFMGLPLGAGRGGYGGPPRGLIPSAGPPPGSRAPGRYDPASGLGQLHGGFPQQQHHMQHPQGMHSQGLSGGGGKAPAPLSMQPGAAGGYSFPLANGGSAAAGMFGNSPASLAYNLASLQQQAQSLNGMHPGGPPSVSGPAGAGPRNPGKLNPGSYGASSTSSSHQLTNLKALALASGLGPFQGGGGPDPDGGAGGGGGGFSSQQPSDADYAEAAAAAVNAAAAAGLAQVADYSYHDASSFSTAPAPGWSS